MTPKRFLSTKYVLYSLYIPFSMHLYVFLMTKEHHYNKKGKKPKKIWLVILCHVYVIFWAVNQQMMTKRGSTPRNRTGLTELVRLVPFCTL